MVLAEFGVITGRVGGHGLLTISPYCPSIFSSDEEDFGERAGRIGRRFTKWATFPRLQHSWRPSGPALVELWEAGEEGASLVVVTDSDTDSSSSSDESSSSEEELDESDDSDDDAPPEVPSPPKSLERTSVSAESSAVGECDGEDSDERRDEGPLAWLWGMLGFAGTTTDPPSDPSALPPSPKEAPPAVTPPPASPVDTETSTPASQAHSTSGKSSRSASSRKGRRAAVAAAVAGHSQRSGKTRTKHSGAREGNALTQLEKRKSWLQRLPPKKYEAEVELAHRVDPPSPTRRRRRP
uniref:Uncharacterized protein n=1 Tax=Tetraselmis chuii TaxID=63592 RepID=A0A7S1SKV9_9CHLO|mmetsp:Transcript_174/g.298  ORF Transcript_174/g.298 Transcript_174/m.298 type:complete len:296 (+) Transcript_174:206-1093(+)|eukprot:CAMPEP_0177754672 /NCGR_PEP_ID=MMETSP0491_2-20121128/2134_1 /TAXON_ID=63592 /ORGANISM="Tetraselmis chuii, Strain PLY429" /LENGTH=295 /DNA_ID=CAMNT_0019270071 /DNA_START=190 /DNA_END=1077 /DNA_ORIENTATION=-